MKVRALLAIAAVLVIQECGGAVSTPVEIASPDASTIRMLDDLEVKGRAPMTGYDRDLFGPAWADTDHNGCDTRNDILQRDLARETLKPGTHNCVVLAGVLEDPYTGERITFQRGQDTSTFVQIDHVVALGDAWQTGAQGWSAEKRLEFANDPANLLAVDGATNQQKGASDAASWLPPNKKYRCSYAVIQVKVKAEYDLWVKPAEKKALTKILKNCPE